MDTPDPRPLNRQGYLQVLFLSKNHHWLEQATRNNYISQYHRELPYAAEFQPSCILHTLGPCLFVYSFNCSYAEGFLVVFDMRQCKITEVLIWRHVVNVPKTATTFRGILICVIFRPGICKNTFLCSVLHWRIIMIKRFFSGLSSCMCTRGQCTHKLYICVLS
jgi:hypothetical protein